MTSTGTSAPARLDHRRARRKIISFWLMLALALGALLGQVPEPAAAATCPCSIFTSGQTPANPAENDTDAVELGVKFRADQAGFITGIRFYKGTGNTGAHTGSLWSAAGARLATVTFTGETATGWQQALFASPVAVTANTTLHGLLLRAGRPVRRRRRATSRPRASTNSPLTALANGVDGGNGVYRYGSGGGFPSSTLPVDQLLGRRRVRELRGGHHQTHRDRSEPRRPAPPASRPPARPCPRPSARRRRRQPGRRRHRTAARRWPAPLSYVDSTRTVTFTPSARPAPWRPCTVSVTGARDSAGNADGSGHLDLHDRDQQQRLPVHDLAVHRDARPRRRPPTPPPWSSASSSEPRRPATSPGIRFYKGTGNTGTHTGSLWNSTGTTRLATVTFSGETATGWQQATFGAPVPVTANTTYVASYYAPVGRYSNNNAYFASAATTRGPLTALRNGTDGGNGLYRYGACGLPEQHATSPRTTGSTWSSTPPRSTPPPRPWSRKSPAAGSDSASRPARR